MDLERVAATREHYNRHVNIVSADQALKARNEGAALPLKQYHNKVKRMMINRFAYEAERLLDLACGRGGDILKWIDAQISYVKGLDLSPREIEEARTRMKQSQHKAGRLRAEFEDTAVLGQSLWQADATFDVVTCMFALHYFFATDASLDMFLKTVALNLKPGGYFMATCPDGGRVRQLLGSQKVYEGRMLRLEQQWSDEVQDCGSGYAMAIGDTVTAGHDDNLGSQEYLVDADVLQRAAARHGLKPVIRLDDDQLEAMLDPADRGRFCKHFNPRFPGSDESLVRASALNAAFILQKTAAEEGMPPPRPSGLGFRRGMEADRRPEKRQRQASEERPSTAAAAAPPGSAQDGAQKPDAAGDGEQKGLQGKQREAVASAYKRPTIRRRKPA